jgi:hypothetical protein
MFAGHGFTIGSLQEKRPGREHSLDRCNNSQGLDKVSILKYIIFLLDASERHGDLLLLIQTDKQSGQPFAQLYWVPFQR